MTRPTIPAPPTNQAAPPITPERAQTPTDAGTEPRRPTLHRCDPKPLPASRSLLTRAYWQERKNRPNDPDDMMQQIRIHWRDYLPLSLAYAAVFYVLVVLAFSLLGGN